MLPHATALLIEFGLLLTDTLLHQTQFCMTDGIPLNIINTSRKGM
jgi:hypothetical protein